VLWFSDKGILSSDKKNLLLFVGGKHFKDKKCKLESRIPPCARVAAKLPDAKSLLL